MAESSVNFLLNKTLQIKRLSEGFSSCIWSKSRPKNLILFDISRTFRKFCFIGIIIHLKEYDLQDCLKIITKTL